jgi:hypothetical protein
VSVAPFEAKKSIPGVALMTSRCVKNSVMNILGCIQVESASSQN